ncbi:MAG: hypothetical protein ACI9IL_000364 [Rickettsiales bacterium]|jgi:hypothetical protein
MVRDFDDPDSLYNSNILNQIASELKKERQDIEELSVILHNLNESFRDSSKSDISNPVRLALKLKKLNSNYREIFFNLINIAVNDSKNGSFITLNYNKVYYFADLRQVKALNLVYKNILHSREGGGEFTEKEFKNFITKCSNIVNEIVSTIITRPDTDLIIKKTR